MCVCRTNRHGDKSHRENPFAPIFDLLENIHERWTRIPGGGEEVVPNIHPRAREDGYPRSAVGQAGYHQADTACPIAEHTWKSAYWSAQSALNGADFIAKGGQNAYALSRPRASRLC